MTNEQPGSSQQSEPTANYLSGLATVIKELQSEEKLIGALLLGILALLIVVIPSVPEDKRVFVWFATTLSVLLIFLVFHYWTKSSVSKLGKIKRERNDLKMKSEDLRNDYAKLVISNNNRLSHIDQQIHQINGQLRQLSEQGDLGNQEAQALIQQLTNLAEDIQKQVEHNSDVSSRIKAGIQTVADASEIAHRLSETKS